MNISKIKRLIILLVFRLSDGHGRYKLAKRLKLFNRIGRGCYLGSYNFGTEPFLISFGDNVVLGTGVRFINHDMSAEMISVKVGSKFGGLSLFGEIVVGNNVFIELNAAGLNPHVRWACELKLTSENVDSVLYKGLSVGARRSVLLLIIFFTLK